MRKQLSRDESTSSVGTLARGLDILELFGGDTPELTQKEISERLDLPVPTVHRLAKVLVERGWLARDPASRRLRLGLGATRLMSGLPLTDLAREHLRGLADRTGETANLATLDDGEVLYLASETGTHLLTLRGHAGLRLPVHCTALGKALLAQLPDEEARRAAGAAPYRAFTDRTITAWGPLRASLERVRREGVAHSRDEFEVGLRSIAVPLSLAERGGSVAINVSLPTSRAGRDALTEISRELRATAEAIRGGAA
jgi:DNA-binding IclR family transcriptional regulator